VPDGSVDSNATRARIETVTLGTPANNAARNSETLPIGSGIDRLRGYSGSIVAPIVNSSKLATGSSLLKA